MKKKKHHYIQEAYLGQFSRDGRTFVFEKERNIIRPANIEDVYEENNFYRLPIIKYYPLANDEDKNKIDEDIVARFGKKFPELSEEEKNKAEELFEDFFGEIVEPKFLEIKDKLFWNIGKTFLGYMDSPITEEIRYILSKCISAVKFDKFKLTFVR